MSEIWSVCAIIACVIVSFMWDRLSVIGAGMERSGVTARLERVLLPVVVVLAGRKRWRLCRSMMPPGPGRSGRRVPLVREF